MLFIIQTVITGHIVIFAIHALMHGLEAATKMLSLYTFFYQHSFHEYQKSQKTLKNKDFFQNCLAYHLELFFEKRKFFDGPVKLLISCYTNKITLSLSFNANLAKLGPILGPLYYTYYILHGCWKFLFELIKNHFKRH